MSHVPFVLDPILELDFGSFSFVSLFTHTTSICSVPFHAVHLNERPVLRTANSYKVSSTLLTGYKRTSPSVTPVHGTEMPPPSANWPFPCVHGLDSVLSELGEFLHGPRADLCNMAFCHGFLFTGSTERLGKIPRRFSPWQCKDEQSWELATAPVPDHDV